MSGNITFTIIKPYAVSNGHIGPILNMIHEKGFQISAMRMLWLTKGEAQRFYEVHKERPFYNDLVEFMTSGPIVVAVLKKENAVLARNSVRRVLWISARRKRSTGFRWDPLSLRRGPCP